MFGSVAGNLEFAVDYKIKFSKDFGLPSLHLVQKSKIVEPAGQVWRIFFLRSSFFGLEIVHVTKLKNNISTTGPIECKSQEHLDF